MKYEQLKLDNQICFPLYAASRLVIREYQPMLDKLGITHPQYLVLLVLWEQNGQPVNDIAKKLILNTNTITPLLKRLETQGIVTRERSKEDERKVIVLLTEKGKALQDEASCIPMQLAAGMQATDVATEDLAELKKQLQAFIDFMKKKA